MKKASRLLIAFFATALVALGITSQVFAAGLPQGNIDTVAARKAGTSGSFVNVDGGSVSLTPGDELEVQVTANIDSSWKSTGVKVSSSAGETFYCADHANFSSGSGQEATFIIPKGQIPPGTPSSKNLYVKLYDTENCDNGGSAWNTAAQRREYLGAVEMAPIGVPDGYFANAGDSLVGNVLDNDAKNASTDNSPVTVSLVSYSGGGELDLNPDGSFTYSPGESFTGGETFTYRVHYVGLASGADPNKMTDPVTVTLVTGDVTDLILSSIVNTSGGGTVLETLVDITVEVPTSGDISTVFLPAGTVITQQGGGAIDPLALTKDTPEANALTGLGSGKVVKGALQWGISGETLEFNPAITISLFVGTDLNGQTLNIVRSPNGDGGWTSEGLSQSTCVVADGYCTFEATKASYYAATSGGGSSPSGNTSSSGSSSGGSRAEGCNAQLPGTKPALFRVDRTGASATLWIEPGGNPYTGFIVWYGLGDGTGDYADTFDYRNAEGMVVHTINELSPGATYSFRVQSHNDCAYSDSSNVITSRGGTNTTFANGTMQSAGQRVSGAAAAPAAAPTAAPQAETQPTSAPQEQPSQEAVTGDTGSSEATQSQGFWGWLMGLFGR